MQIGVDKLMNFITILKHKLEILINFFTLSNSKNDVKSTTNKIRTSIEVKPQKIVQGKPIKSLVKIRSEKSVQTISHHQTPLEDLLNRLCSLSTNPIIPLIWEPFDTTPKIIKLNANDIHNFPPGYVFDTNVPANFEDYPQLLENGPKIKAKLMNKPIYLLSKTKEEFTKKKCPKNHDELVIDNGFTGKKRNFDIILEKLPNALGCNIYYVNIKNCKKLHDKTKEHLSKLKEYGLHPADSEFLAFTKLTNSTLVTCDKELIRCSKLAQCKYIEFQGFLEKALQPSPITLVLKERRAHRKKHPKTRNYRNWKNKGYRNSGVWN